MIKNKTNTNARFRIRSIFLFVNLMVLFLPLFGVIFFRFYENQLVNQTETDLISQAAVLSATYKQYLRDEKIDNEELFGRPIKVQISSIDEYYSPISPQANLFAGDILPPRPNGVPFKGLTLIAQASDPANIDSAVEMAEVTKEKPSLKLAGSIPPPAEDTITVIGSRVKGRTALESSVPIDVIQEDADLPETPTLSLADAISDTISEKKHILPLMPCFRLLLIHRKRHYQGSKY